MKKIGIVYAMSHAAGEHCKNNVYKSSAEKLEIVTHECSVEAYKAAASDINQIARLIFESIQILQKNGAKIVIIAANSVHRAFNIVKEHVKKDFPEIILISIIDACLEDIRNKNIKAVGILGSNATISSNIYQSKLNDEKIATIPLSSEDQAFIHSLISSGVSPNTIGHDAKQKVISIARKLKKAGCDAILLACTELPLIFNSYNLGISVVDTNRSLALAAVKAAATHTNLCNSSTNNSSAFQTKIRAKL